MKKINAFDVSVIPIGKQGENLATRVFFPVVKDWTERYGEGTYQLLHQRNGDENPYAVVISRSAEAVMWDVTSTDVAAVGLGQCELIYTVGETIAKSCTFATKTLASLSDAGDTPPEPWESWVDEVLEAGSQAQQSAVSAGASAESAEHSAEVASEKAGEAETSAINANISAQAAQDAANSMSFVSFDIDPDGDLYINRSEHLGTTAFELNENGELEVSI